MLNMYLGLLDGDQVKAAARLGTNREKSKRDCEASFFLGKLALHNGQFQQARNALREVTSACGPAETVYSAAIAEAKLLPRQ